MRSTILPLCLVFMLAGCDQGTKDTTVKPINVGVTTLKSQPVTLFTQLPGRTTAVRTAEVRPQVSGIILKRLFVEGSDVKAGQPLYLIDPASYQATYDKALATLENARQLATRYKPLMEARAVSKQSYDDAVAAEKQAKAELEIAQVNLNYTNVRSPITGRIGRSLYTEGALVTNGQSNYLTTIQQLDPIYVDVSESSLQLLRQRRALAEGKLQAVGDNAAAVKLTLEDGSDYVHMGKLEFSEVTVDETTGSITMRAFFPNPNRELLPGMFVHAVLPQGVAHQRILAPQQSIMHDPKGRPYVYKIGADNKVVEQAIKTGEMINGQWLVTEGLKSGDRVVVDGLQLVRNGSLVSPSEHQPKVFKRANLTTADPSAQ
ncbi:efflux RND transporter periplasmic adaptor subunit [Pantoea coffeiphila]|uniref:Efflux transporter periplasmic adaptor subunit n=1 Tax=Pantoea coffeiphila TaxID=1465635 RepID=A0A2S9I8W5_9GAMM|nr:efflux RND transporter periplasmic adaptor subunit [Pantoea coffeiphila]PRD14226.1 efflux transporter periplasmic adaptor subunit [Pantoea coffeiphila]